MAPIPKGEAGEFFGGFERIGASPEIDGRRRKMNSAVQAFPEAGFGGWLMVPKAVVGDSGEGLREVRGEFGRGEELRSDVGMRVSCRVDSGEDNGEQDRKQSDPRDHV